jgi:hypothetical protein
LRVAFGEVFGVTPACVLAGVQPRRAFAPIPRGDAPVVPMAVAAGFADQAHMRRCTDHRPQCQRRLTLGGIINQDSDDTLAFAPDGNTVFFDRSESPRKTIMVSHRINGHWSPPQAASFSGRWFDQDPLVAPNGRFLLFNSD